MAELFVTRENGIAIVDFQEKEILDIAKSKAIGDKLCAIVDQGDDSNLLIDFRFLRLMTSSMIGEFLQLRKKCNESQINLKFCALSNELADLLKKLKLDKVFEIYKSRELAVKAFMKNKS